VILGSPWQTWAWLAAVLADGVVIYVTSSGGDWRLPSAAHWAERHGLVLILALGESIVAIGTGAANEPISAALLVGVALALVLSITLWWSYFDKIAGTAEEILTASTGLRRATLASTGYTYLHLPLIAGIVISALGVESVISHVSDAEPLGLFGAIALFGGTSLYVAGLSFFWFRMVGKPKVVPFVGATLMIALIPIAAVLPALAALLVLVLCTSALVVVTARRS
jgi:low temperature requirement protein LtrA